MLISLLEWVAGWILKYLLGKAEKSAQDAIADMVQDTKRQVINEANSKKYDAAIDRKERINAALDLINRRAP